MPQVIVNQVAQQMLAASASNRGACLRMTEPLPDGKVVTRLDDDVLAGLLLIGGVVQEVGGMLDVSQAIVRACNAELERKG